jgi:uncharacterized membrane protein
MNGWLIFAGVLALFFATHSVPVRPPVKRRLVEYIGRNGFTIAYSALSLLMLELLIWASRQAPVVLLWSEAPWHRHLAWVGMLCACLILAIAIGRPNPFSFGGLNNDRFDPTIAGIIGYLRHPFLGALALWGGMHLLVNGDLAQFLLFGTLSFFAFVGHRIVDMRKKRLLGADHWTRLLSQTRKHLRVQLPARSTALRLCARVAVYLILVVLHPVVIGRSVFL